MASKNLSDLVTSIHSEHPELSRDQVHRSVKLINDTIINALCSQSRVEIRGFGSFFLSVRPSHMFHNPRTGEQLLVPPRRIPRFKAGKSLRESVDSSGAARR